mgnify:CR=1 FL=1
MLVNDVEIPAGVIGTNMTGTGWYNIPTLGKRSGGFNYDFLDGSGTTRRRSIRQHGVSFRAWCPIGSTMVQSLPKVVILVQGLKATGILERTGAIAESSFRTTPAWILLDILRRSGWSLSEIDVRELRLGGGVLR